jgi:hypothetical protein
MSVKCNTHTICFYLRCFWPKVVYSDQADIVITKGILYDFFDILFSVIGLGLSFEYRHYRMKL